VVAANPLVDHVGASAHARAAAFVALPHERGARAYIESSVFALEAVGAAAFSREGFRYFQEGAGGVR
jgi:hypothetical protein